MKSALGKIYNILFSTADRRVGYYIFLLCWLKRRGQRVLGFILARRLQRRYGVFLPYDADFDSTLTLRHPIGVVIGEGVKIGENVIIYQNVTLGRSSSSVAAYPKIGDNTVIYAGAVILGGISVGSGCVIGANAVVTKDVPDGALAVGIPAKFIFK